MAKGWMVTTPTAINALARTQLHGAKTLDVPESCRGILSVIPFLGQDTPTTKEPEAAKVEIDSDDVAIKPYFVLAPVGMSSLAKAGLKQMTRLKQYPMNVKVPGGAHIGLWGHGLFDHTVEPYIGVAVEISTDIPTLPQVKAVVGTYTATGAAAGTITGTAYTITGGTKLIEAYGAVVLTTVATSELVIGYFKFESTEFIDNFPLQVPFDPLQGALITDATTPSVMSGMHEIASLKCDLNIKPALTKIQDYLVMTTAPGTTGNFITGVMFI